MYESITLAILNNELPVMNIIHKHDDCKAFKIAIKEGQKDIVKFFISNGYDILCDCIDPLETSIKYGHLHITKYLSDMYDINKDKYIKIAAKNGDMSLLEFLIKTVNNISKKDLIEAIGITRNTDSLSCSFLEEVYTDMFVE